MDDGVRLPDVRTLIFVLQFQISFAVLSLTQKVLLDNANQFLISVDVKPCMCK
jgi:hypothetical protein